jgi:hypothetical protein
VARGFISFEEVFFPEDVRKGEYHNCPGSAEPPAPDGSNVFSSEQQQELGCRESDRAVK